MMHDSDWEAAAYIARYKRNLIGSSRKIEIEIPRVLSEFISYQEVSGEGEPQAHVDRQPNILHQEYGDYTTTGKWRKRRRRCIRHLRSGEFSRRFLKRRNLVQVGQQVGMES